jgi:hypothetical protein
VTAIGAFLRRGLGFSLPRFFTSRKASLAPCIPFVIYTASPVNRKPVSNGVHVHSAEEEQFPPPVSLSDYGVQPSRLPGLEGVCFSENGEILDSDDSEDDLPSVSEIVARSSRVPVQTRPPRPVVDLTCNSDDDDTEVS